MKEKVIEYLKKEYTDTEIDSRVDDEIHSGNWVDSDWEEDGEFDSEYDWYQEFGRGEAEDVVLEELVTEIETEFGITKEQYKIENDEDIYETIQELFPKLQTV